MLVVAVTGGMGAGKSSAAGWFASRGAVVLDLDEMAKALLDEPGVRDELVGAFGSGVLAADGRVDRAALASAAFADDASTRLLDAIVHPRVVGEVRARLESLATGAGTPSVAVVDVPLLAESPELQSLADVTLLVTAPEETRVRRLIAKGVPEDEARRRIARQASEDERRAIANAVVENEDDEEALYRRLEEFWEREVAPHAHG